jgi:hypothetical protein
MFMDGFFAVFLFLVTNFDRFSMAEIPLFLYIQLISFEMIVWGSLARLLQYKEACSVDGSLIAR